MMPPSPVIASRIALVAVAGGVVGGGGAVVAPLMVAEVTAGAVESAAPSCAVRV